MKFLNWLISLFKKEKTIEDRALEIADKISSNDFYPKAMFVPTLAKLKSQYNVGKVYKYYFIHWTAGWQNQTATSFFNNFIKRKLCADFMEQDGQIFIQRDWDKSGSHLGKANYNGSTLHSRHGAGLEIACGGLLTDRNGELFTWFNKKVLREDARYVTVEQGYVREGWYEIFKQEQEDSLADWISYLLYLNIEIVTLGHDDVSGYRGKSDPGGSLSLPLSRFIEEKALPLVKQWQ